jgi:apolipoprotein N-acyltransferase
VAYFRSKSFFASILTGLLLWVSFPGGGEIWPLLPVALVPMLFAVRGANVREASLCGFVAGLVHFVLLLYWIIIVVGKYGGLAWYISLFALLGLALYLSLYFALFALLARYLLSAFPAAVSLWLLPALWVGIDWLRGVFLTGFPWMDLGYALYESPHLIQIADLAGHHGVTFLVVFTNSLLVLIFSARRSVLGYILFIIPAFCLAAGASVYSNARFKEVSQKLSSPDAHHILVGIVQGNIDQSEKWTPSQQAATVENYLSQTESLFGSNKPSLVVWPETALPFYPPANTNMQPLRKQVAVNDFALLTGAPWYEIVDKKSRRVKFFNSALLLQPDGYYGGKYYKTHLVPFGEYIPLKRFLPFLAPLVEAVGDFSPGKIEQPLVWQGARAGILICFESVFPEMSRKWVLSGANVLVNLTNDAWYGKSSAPHHSLAMSVFRAVETRRSLVRSANTGISAFVNPVGIITERSELFEPWAAAAEVYLTEEVTVWVRFGYLFGPICLAVGLVAGLAGWIQKRWT